MSYNITIGNKLCVMLALFICSAHTITKAEEVLSWKKSDTHVEIEMSEGKLKLTPMNPNAIRVQYIRGNGNQLPEYVFLEQKSKISFQVNEFPDRLEVATSRLHACIDRQKGNLVFKDASGNVLLAEEVNGRSMNVVELRETYTYGIQQKFISPSDEYLYGTGQFQDGYLNIKGLSRRLTQLNTQISVPFILSNKGYGLLWHNYGLTYFNPADNKVTLQKLKPTGNSERVDVTTTEGTKHELRIDNLFRGTLQIKQGGTYSILLDVGQRMAREHNIRIDGKQIVEVNNIWLPRTTSFMIDLEEGEHDIVVEGESEDKPEVFFRKVTDETVFRSPVADCIDYTVFSGYGDEVISSYRELSGNAPMMPRWALGYIHCRERFKTQKELLETSKEFRKRKLPLDVVVQDWMYWGKYGWNAMKFDEQNYPDPAGMVNELHQMNMRLMISVWSKIDPTSDVGKGAERGGHYIPGTEWIDFFNEESADYYWNNFSKNLLKPYGIDAWWQDATEPENDDLQGRWVNHNEWAGERVRNIYPLLVNKTVYEGIRKDMPGKRTMILTRSGFSGLQRYAAATWSGDVGNDWETFRRQIVGGLGYMAAGLPWWTYDAGGFFRPGSGQYEDKDFHERFLRWFQVATFLPLQRVHGYQTDTEFWNYGSDVVRIARQYLTFRYRMLPYIYSEAAAVTFKGSTLMRPFIMDFPNDPKALQCKYSYMFGPSLLVAPVVEPGITVNTVYLPDNHNVWYDFWTGEKYKGGRTVDVPVTIDKIPLFVKAGSIIPLGEPKQHTEEKADDTWEIRIYPGADAHYTVYEDEGTNYNYEQGAFSTFDLSWDDKKKVLMISDRNGSFSGMVQKRKLNIVKVAVDKGTGFEKGHVDKNIEYIGKQIQINL